MDKLQGIFLCLSPFSPIKAMRLEALQACKFTCLHCVEPLPHLFTTSFYMHHQLYCVALFCVSPYFKQQVSTALSLHLIKASMTTQKAKCRSPFYWAQMSNLNHNFILFLHRCEISINFVESTIQPSTWSPQAVVGKCFITCSY